MHDILHSVTRGIWTAHVVQISTRADSVIRLDHPNGYRVFWPIRHASGEVDYVDYDWPEIQQDGQRATRAAFRWRDKQPVSVTENTLTYKEEEP